MRLKSHKPPSLYLAYSLLAASLNSTSPTKRTLLLPIWTTTLASHSRTPGGSQQRHCLASRRGAHAAKSAWR
eukprot:1355408-Pyramimonas_sp.AAC.2